MGELYGLNACKGILGIKEFDHGAATVKNATRNLIVCNDHAGKIGICGADACAAQ